MATMVKINTYYIGMYAKFLEKLRGIPDGDGSVLDHSMLVYGAGMADSNGHATDPLPVVFAGGAAGKGHRHVQVATRTPIGNLWRNVAEQFGTGVDQFGDSSGKTDVFA
jgi:hypothetical protein